MAIEPEPYLWMQENEVSAQAECGCELHFLRGPMDAAYFQCPLHAAAPDLLAACEHFEAVYGPDRTFYEMQQTMKMIHEAIAKAKGVKACSE